MNASRLKKENTIDVASLAVTLRTRHTQIDHLECETKGMITKNNKKSHLHPNTRPTDPQSFFYYNLSIGDRL